MPKIILAALLALSAGPALAQSTTGPNDYVASPDIPNVDTGPRYCPELAGTEHPFRVRCPSWPDHSNVVVGATIGISVGQGIVGDNRGTLVEEDTVVGGGHSIVEEANEQD